MARRWAWRLLAAIVIGLAAPLVAVAQQDQIPSEVWPGSGYDIVKSGLAASTKDCSLLLNKKPVGGCAGPQHGPLTGHFDVPEGHPAGSQVLSCRGCHRIGDGPSPTNDPSPSSSSPSPSTPGPVAMPDLTGRTSSSAQSALKGLGWHGKWDEQPSGTTFCQSAGLPPDTIASQSPKPGTVLGLDQTVSVDMCLPTPGLRRQPIDVEIEVATIVVRAVPPTTLHWILLLLLALGVVIAGTLLVLRLLRSPTGPRPMMRLRPFMNAVRIAVQPPDGPGTAHRVRLVIHRDPGTRTVQEEHRGRP